MTHLLQPSNGNLEKCITEPPPPPEATTDRSLMRAAQHQWHTAHIPPPPPKKTQASTGTGTSNLTMARIPIPTRENPALHTHPTQTTLTIALTPSPQHPPCRPGRCPSTEPAFTQIPIRREWGSEKVNVGAEKCDAEDRKNMR